MNREGRRRRAAGPFSCRALLGVAFALAAVSIARASAAEEPEAAILATHRHGSFSSLDLEVWRGDRKSSETLPELIARAALIEALAAEAVAAGRLELPHVRSALEDVRNRVLSTALNRRVLGEIRVSSEEVEAAAGAFRSAASQRRLRNLFLAAPPKLAPAARTERRARIEALRLEILAGATFARLAREHSDSTTAAYGGLMGKVERQQLSPQIAEIAFELGEGQLSEVIETRTGFVLILCERILDPSSVPSDEAVRRVEKSMLSREGEQAWSSLQAALLAAASPVYTLDGETTLVRYAGGELTRQMLGAGEPSRQQLAGYVQRTVNAREARRRGLDGEPEISARLHRERQEYLAAGELSRRVDTMLAEPTAAALSAYYEQHPTRFRQPVKVDVRAILVAGSGNYEAGRSPGEIKARIESGEMTFADAARQFSDHASAAEDGALGWLQQRRLLNLGTNVLQAVQAAGEGDLIGPVQEAQGFWLLLLVGRTDARLPPFEEVRPRVLDLWLAASRRELRPAAQALLTDEMAVRLASSAP